jgi:hypothetical protein
MDDLNAFLAARLDEDERELVKDPPVGLGYANLGVRMLREVEAKRALLRMHEPVLFWGNSPPPLKDRTPENAVAWYCECQCPDGVIEGAYPCDTARLLAAVYSDHPDYRPEWKP